MQVQRSRHLLYFCTKVALSSNSGLIKWIFEPVGTVVVLKHSLCSEDIFPAVTLPTVQLKASLVSVFYTRLKMVCLCWLLLVVMAYVCVPGCGSVCSVKSSICNDLSSKGRILVGQTVLLSSILFISSLFLRSLGKASKSHSWKQPVTKQCSFVVHSKVVPTLSIILHDEEVLKVFRQMDILNTIMWLKDRCCSFYPEEKTWNLSKSTLKYTFLDMRHIFYLVTWGLLWEQTQRTFLTYFSGIIESIIG